jgi:hypothetical protein
MPKRQRNKTQSNGSDQKDTLQHPLQVRSLSVEKCRSLLPQALNLSDTEIEALRDSIYCLAAVALDMAAEQKATSTAS